MMSSLLRTPRPSISSTAYARVELHPAIPRQTDHSVAAEKNRLPNKRLGCILGWRARQDASMAVDLGPAHPTGWRVRRIRRDRDITDHSRCPLVYSVFDARNLAFFQLVAIRSGWISTLPFNDESRGSRVQIGLEWCGQGTFRKATSKAGDLGFFELGICEQ